MGIQEDIFNEFFKMLEEEGDVPTNMVEELRRIWESDEIFSEEKIREVVEMRSENDSENQND